MQRTSSLTVSKRFDIRELLREKSQGTLKKLTIEDIQKDERITAAAIDTFSLLLQRCPEIRLYEVMNDLIEVPEITISHCGLVELPKYVKCTVMNVTDSTLHIEDETRSVSVQGDVVLFDSNISGNGRLIVHGDLYVDSETLENLDNLPVDYRNVHNVELVDRKYG